MALRNLLVRVGADTSALAAGMNNARSEVKRFADSVTGAMGGLKGKIAGALAGLAGVDFLKQGIDDASQYEAAMATLGSTFGKSTQQFNDWAATTGHAMGYSRLESAKLAQTLSLNFRSIATSQEDLVAKTTKMEEVAALIANKRGMAMTEVSDRIRSAMNAEADGADELGVNVRVAALQQSKAYKEMANGEPWQKLSTATQKQILYSSILEQVTATLGSTMQDTTALRMSVFSAALGDVRLALGQAFLPILYNVLPLLTMLMEWMYKALQVFAAFMTALFGGFKFGAGNQLKVGGIGETTDATKQQTDAVNNLGKAHDATAKKAKASGAAQQKAAKLGVAGFDEVNTLADKAAKEGAGAGAGGAGAGAGGVPAMGAIPTPKIPSPDMSGFNEGVNQMVEGFKKKLAPIKAFFKSIWDDISIFFKRTLSFMSIWWFEHGDQIMKALKNLWTLIQPVVMWLVHFIWDSIQGLIKGIVTFFEGLIEFFTGIFTGDWGMIWQGLKDMVIGAFLIVWNWFNLSFFGGLKKLFLTFAEDGLKVVITFGRDFIKNFHEIMIGLVDKFFNFIKGMKQFFSDFGGWFESNAVNIGHKVIAAFEKIGEVGHRIWAAIQGAFMGAVNWFMRSVITPLINNFDNIREGFKHGLASGLGAVVNSIRGPLNDAIDGFNAFAGTLHIPLHIDHIPRFATGGIVSRATLAMVGEGRGPEAITPIDKLQGFITNAIMDTMKANGGMQTGGDIILNIDGRRLARIVKPYLDNANKRIGTNVRLNTI